MAPLMSDRVRENTEDWLNAEIDRATLERVRCVAAGGHAAIERRLIELSEEWDIERYLETMAPSMTLAGILLSMLKDRRWLLLSIGVQSFFLQHAIQGWCPPIPVLRRLGVRTSNEINAERHALKALRGDYQDMDIHEASSAAEGALQAAD
jgi:hypothetical protein